MSNKKKVDLVAYFLKSSPASNYRSFTEAMRPKDDPSNLPSGIPNDSSYLSSFLNDLEVFGISNTNFSASRPERIQVAPHFRKVFPSMLVMKKPTPGSQQEPEQLSESIRLVSSHSGHSTIPLQQLEQRLQATSSQVIADARTKLKYLFKMLLHKRDKITPESLEFDANLQLSRSIIDALSRAQNGEQTESWRELEAMEKLLKAREYHKKGMRTAAFSSLQEIVKDEAASAKTRLEALKVLCSSGQQLGDPEPLLGLMSELQARGEKEYQQMILSSIERIKMTKQ